MSSSSPVDFALDYAARGIVVLPLARGTNRPHAMLGRGWSRDTVGSTDPDVIRSWWRCDPAANVGVLNGPRSGLLVVDVDRKPGKPDGVQSLWAVQAEAGVALPETWTVETPSGGKHLYFRLPVGEDVPIPKAWLHSVELTWQVAAPPSCRPYSARDSSLRDSEVSYLEYRWAEGCDVLADVPSWLLADIRSRPGLPFGGGSTGGSDGPTGVDELPSTEWFTQHGFGGHTGSRNIDCHRLACRLWRHHWPHEDLVTRLVYDAWAATDPTDFPWAEALGCIRSARDFVVPKVQAERAYINELRNIT